MLGNGSSNHSQSLEHIHGMARRQPDHWQTAPTADVASVCALYVANLAVALAYFVAGGAVSGQKTTRQRLCAARQTGSIDPDQVISENAEYDRFD